MVDIGWVADPFPPDVVVQHAPFGGFVDVRQGEIHAVALDGAGYATDEEHGAVRFLSLDDSNVRQRVVHLAIPVVVPCIVEEDEIARVGDRSLVECALLLYVRMDEADSIYLMIAFAAAVQIDPVSEKHRTGHPRAIISDTPAVALNRFGTDQFRRCLHDRGPARCRFDGATTGACARCRCARTFDRLRGATYERHDGDSGCDEEQSHCLTVR